MPKLCKCGCGGLTKRSRNYMRNHDKRKSPVPYTVVSTGHTTPCWIWAWGITGRGYGAIRVDGKTKSAHIVYYEEANGLVPQGYQLDHLCRVRACVNPNHLEPVSCATNIRRGRQSKLTEEQVLAIIGLLKTGKPQMAVAREFNVSRGAIGHIFHGRCWKGVI